MHVSFPLTASLGCWTYNQVAASAPTLNFHATNRYWVDPQDGFILRSEQHLTPQ
ncbi:YjbF family lipoprotein, partial [Pseudomonas sp. NPDC089918]|uniref:YjbF family lipoprotein n=1 Tax=Pseudomonas sp. NPDC089918 TaxID=3390654 RepID=UPI003D03579A